MARDGGLGPGWGWTRPQPPTNFRTCAFVRPPSDASCELLVKLRPTGASGLEELLGPEMRQNGWMVAGAFKLRIPVPYLKDVPTANPTDHLGQRGPLLGPKPFDTRDTPSWGI